MAKRRPFKPGFDLLQKKILKLYNGALTMA